MAYLSEGKLEQAQGFGGQSGGRDNDAGGALDHTAEQVGSWRQIRYSSSAQHAVDGGGSVGTVLPCWDQDAAAAASSHRDHDEGAAVQVSEHAIHGPSADAEHQGQLGPRGPDQPGPGSKLGQLSRLVEGQAAGGAGDPLGKAAHCRRIQTAG